MTLAQPTTRLTIDSGSGDTALGVMNVTGFAINQVLLMGNWGDESACIVKTSSSTSPTPPTPSAPGIITLVTGSAYPYAVDSTITVIGYDYVEFSRATTLTGSKTVLATLPINASETATGYLDLQNNTGYGFARFYNSINGFFSEYSDGVPYAGSPVNSVQSIITKAVKDCGNVLNDDFCNELDLIADCQEAQDEISAMRDWSYELYQDTSSLVTINGETSYSLEGLALKYDDEGQSLLSVRLGNLPIDAVAYSQIENAQALSNSDVLASDATVGATSITLTNSNSFQPAGTVLLRTNGFVSYTANDPTTGILSGIDPTAITTLVPAGATVWQNISTGTPRAAAVIDESLNLDIPPDATNSGINLKFRFLRKLPSLTSFASTTLVPFPKVMAYYVESCIERRKRNYDESDRLYGVFQARVNEQAARYKIQLRRAQQLYALKNTSGCDNNDSWDDWFN